MHATSTRHFYTPFHALACDAQTVKPDFSNFDDSSAWPYLLDEFVEHMRSTSGNGASG
jgi:hypothetical protein